MSKDEINQFDSTASNNTDIEGINTSETMVPSAVNNAIRSLMSLLKKQDVGTHAMTSPNIDGGTIDGVTMATSDITVGSGKTLNVSAGTLTLADDQISGDKINGGSISSTFVGNLTGDVTGNVSGTAATVTGAAQSAITSVGNLTSLNIVGTTTSDFLVIQTNEDGAGSAPDVTLFRNSASPADSDHLGKIEWRANNSAGEPTQYSYISGQVVDVTDGTEDGRLYLVTKQNGADTTSLTLDANGATFAGNVGVGTTAPARIAHLSASTADTSVLRIENTSSHVAGVELLSTHGNWGVYNSDTVADALEFRDDSAAATRMIINSAGDVGVGTTAPSAFGGTTMQVHHASTYSALLVSSNDHVLQMLASDTHGAQSIGTRSNHDLNLTANDSVKATLNTTGHLLLNTTSELSDGRLSIQEALNTGVGITIKNTVTQGAGHTYVRFLNSAGSLAGSIQHTGTTTTSYGTSSDYRLKQGVEDMTGAIERVKALAPKRFQFIADAGTTVDGFLAHEAQTVVPEAVMGTHNEVDDDDNPIMQQIDHSKLVPLLTGALKEAIEKIEALEARITTLEGE